MCVYIYIDCTNILQRLPDLSYEASDILTLNLEPATLKPKRSPNGFMSVGLCEQALALVLLEL